MQCIECDKAQSLTLNSSFQCACIDDYEFVNNVCREVCGDGKLYDLGCDDGNSVGGDGCSAGCLVEADYGCENGTNSSASQCYYTGRMSLSFNYIENTGQVNEGRVSVQLSPNLTTLSQMDLSELSLFYARDQKIEAKAWTYETTGELVLEFDYTRTLETYEANLTVAFDPRFVRSEP